jgi:signal transduction histidine kinase
VAATIALFVAAVLGAWLTSASDLQVIWLSLLALAFGLGAHADGRGALAGVGILTAGTVITTAIESTLTVSGVLFPILMTGAFCVAGRTARSRSRLAGQLHEAAVRANERRAAAAERAVVEERKRIARGCTTSSPTR